jgi:iron complex transport system substrate-binding protein
MVLNEAFRTIKESTMPTQFRSRFIFLSIILLATIFLVSACSPAQIATEAAPTEPPPPTNITVVEPTEEPTDTPQPEPTIAPANTAMPEPTEEAITIVDGLDREVMLAAAAEKIVSMAPSNTEILFAIGAGDQVIGRDEFSDYPAEASDLPSVGGGFGDYNLEAIVDLEPDLVLAAEINTPEQVKALSDLGLTVFLLANPTSLDEMYANLLTVAELTGHLEDTEGLVEDLMDRVAAVDAVIASAEDIPTAFYELDATDPSAPWTAGSGTFIDTLVTQAGGQNIASDLEGQYLQLSIEEILVRDPQVILLGDAAYGVTPESLQERTGWSGLSAVVDNKIYTFDDNLVSRPGPRLVDGLEQLAKLLHPELFTD